MPAELLEPPIVSNTPDLQSILDGNNNDQEGTPLPQSIKSDAPSTILPPKGVTVPPDHKIIKDDTTTTTSESEVTEGDEDTFELLTGHKLGNKPTEKPSAPMKEPVKKEASQKEEPIKKEVPKVEQKKEEKKEEAFKFDPFKLNKKEEAPKEEEIQKQVEQEEQAQQQQQKPKIKNYDGLTEQEAKVFKNMTVESYQFLRPKYDEFKRLKQQGPQVAKPTVPESYFSHEEAYTLLPEYKQSRQLIEGAKFENEYWGQQLELIRSQEKAHMLAINAEGQYVRGQEIEPTVQSERMILNNLTKTNNILSQAEGQLQYIQQQATNIYQDSIQKIKNAEDVYLPFYKEKDNPHQPIIDNIIKAFPKTFQNNPVTSLAAKFAAAYQSSLQQLEEAHKRIAALESGQRESSNRQPNNKTLGAAIRGNSNPANKQEDTSELAEAFNSLVGRKVID